MENTGFRLILVIRMEMEMGFVLMSWQREDRIGGRGGSINAIDKDDYEFCN